MYEEKKIGCCSPLFNPGARCHYGFQKKHEKSVVYLLHLLSCSFFYFLAGIISLSFLQDKVYRTMEFANNALKSLRWRD